MGFLQAVPLEPSQTDLLLLVQLLFIMLLLLHKACYTIQLYPVAKLLLLLLPLLDAVACCRTNICVLQHGGITVQYFAAC